MPDDWWRLYTSSMFPGAPTGIARRTCSALPHQAYIPDASKYLGIFGRVQEDKRGIIGLSFGRNEYNRGGHILPSMALSKCTKGYTSFFSSINEHNWGITW